MQLLFLDESGDHSLAVIDPEYPVFVLGGVLVDADYANRALEEEVARFKMDMFGRPDIVLHTMDIVRQRNGFEALTDSVFRERFYGSLNNLMSRLEYQAGEHRGAGTCGSGGLAHRPPRHRQAGQRRLARGRTEDSSRTRRGDGRLRPHRAAVGTGWPLPPLPSFPRRRRSRLPPSPYKGRGRRERGGRGYCGRGA